MQYNVINIFVSAVCFIEVIAKDPFEIKTQEFDITSEDFYSIVHNIPEFSEGTGFEDFKFGHDLDAPMIPHLGKRFETLPSTDPKYETEANPSDCDDTEESNPEESILKVMEKMITPFIIAHRKFRSQIKQGLVNDDVIPNTETAENSGPTNTADEKFEFNSPEDEVSKSNYSIQVEPNPPCKENSHEVNNNQYNYLKEEQPDVNGVLYDSKSDYLVGEGTEPKYSGEVDNITADGIVMEVYESKSDFQPNSEVKQNRKFDNPIQNYSHSRADTEKMFKTNDRVKDESLPVYSVPENYKPSELDSPVHNSSHSRTDTEKVFRASDRVQEDSSPIYSVPESYELLNENNNEEFVDRKKSDNGGQKNCDSDPKKIITESSTRNLPAESRSPEEDLSNNSQEMYNLFRKLFLLKHSNSDDFSGENVKIRTDLEHSTPPSSEIQPENQGNIVNNVQTFLTGLNYMLE